MLILKYVRFLLLGLIFLVITICVSPVLLIRPFHPNNSSLFIKPLMYLTPLILGIKIELRHHERMMNNVPGIVIGNHQSNLDMFIMAKVVPHTILAIGKKELKFFPIFGMCFWLCRHYFIDRKNKMKALKTLNQVKDDLIANKANLFIMPEGTRSKGKGLGPFKKGPFHLALESGKPLLPFVINNYVHSLDLNKLHAGKVIIKCLDPINLKTLEEQGLNLEEMVDWTRNLIQQEISILDAEVRV